MAAHSSAAGRRWFMAVLLVMVILAVMAGQILNRMARIGAGQGRDETIPAWSASPWIPPTAEAAPVETRALADSTGPAPSGPVIGYFRVASEPTCPSGTDQARSEGKPVVLEWRVTGAEQTTLAVDGDGVYGRYEAVDSEKLTFPCSGQAGSRQAHTYTLVATGENGAESRKLTVEAKVN